MIYEKKNLKVALFFFSFVIWK